MAAAATRVETFAWLEIAWRTQDALMANAAFLMGVKTSAKNNAIVPRHAVGPSCALAVTAASMSAAPSTT